MHRSSLPEVRAFSSSHGKVQTMAFSVWHLRAVNGWGIRWWGSSLALLFFFFGWESYRHCPQPGHWRSGLKVWCFFSWLWQPGVLGWMFLLLPFLPCAPTRMSRNPCQPRHWCAISAAGGNGCGFTGTPEGCGVSEQSWSERINLGMTCHEDAFTWAGLILDLLALVSCAEKASISVIKGIQFVLLALLLLSCCSCWYSK